MISKADFEKSGFLAPPAPAGPPRGSRAGPGARPGPPGRGVPGGSPDPPSEGYFRPKNATFRHYRVSPTVSGILHFERSGPGLGLGEVLHPGGTWTRYERRPTAGSRKVLPDACVGFEDILGLEVVRLEAHSNDARTAQWPAAEAASTDIRCRLIWQGDRVGRQRTPARWWSSSPATEFAGTS